MGIVHLRAALLATGIATALAGSARAQTFPVDRAWTPFTCAGGGPMVDPVADHPGALQERDLVGTAQAPAGFRAGDDEFLYLRLRLDRDPRQGANLRAFAWGYAFSTGGERTRYDALVTVDGAARTVNVYRNSAVTVVDSAEDPADAPPVVTYPFATHGRVVAVGGNAGGDPEAFLDMAVRWSDVAALGLRPETSVVVWAASSTAPDRLNGDFACHDGRGVGAPRLSGSSSEPGRASGVGGAGGMAGAAPGAGGIGGISIEGGPGCSFGRSGRGHSRLLVALALVPLLTRRRRPFTVRPPHPGLPPVGARPARGGADPGSAGLPHGWTRR